MIDEIENFWSTCRKNYAHLKPRGLGENTEYNTHMEKEVFARCDWEGKTVLDYGTGGGFCGLHLFNKYKIKKYVGVDVSPRSLQYARETLQGKNFELHKTPYDFKRAGADVFFSLACIQHFPDKAYLKNFLGNLQSSGIQTIILQIRAGDETVFSNAYKTGGNVGLACIIKPDDLTIGGYVKTNASEIYPSRYMYLQFEKEAE